MSVKYYNIIWADDECESFKRDRLINEHFDNNNIEVLAYVQTSEALKDKLETFKDRVDAVVVDGNFSREVVPYVEKDDISGLIHTISFIDLFNLKRDIPFILYTGRKNKLEEICKNGELGYFTSNNRLIQKGKIEQLVRQIVNDVDHIHSIEFDVKKKNQHLLDMAKKLSKQSEENLYQFLLDEARDRKYDKAVDMFTSLRKILEQTLDGCIENDIVPQAEQMMFKQNDCWSLNNFSRYWGNKFNYVPISGVMPVTISKTIWNLIDIVQDGSHSLTKLNIHVSEYLQETQRPFVFRSCLYQVMDIINWYNDLLSKLYKGSVKLPLYQSSSSK